MKIKTYAESANSRILRYLAQKGETRYSALLKLVSSRGTLALSLRELDEEGLVNRRVVTKKPLETYYSLSKKGEQAAELLIKLIQCLDM